MIVVERWLESVRTDDRLPLAAVLVAKILAARASDAVVLVMPVSAINASLPPSIEAAASVHHAADSRSKTQSSASIGAEVPGPRRYSA
jgi:hypothetical protein